MNAARFRRMVLLALGLCTGLTGRAATVTATFSTATDVPVTTLGYVAAGHTVTPALSFAPAVGTELTIVRNTSLDPILGEFANLAQGQAVALVFGGVEYRFVANYFGGSGNDLVLAWAGVRAFAWGDGQAGQLGTSASSSHRAPAVVGSTGALAGKTIVALAAGGSHTLALCSDGTLAAWGQNDLGQLGDGTTTQRFEPVAVVTAGTPLQGRKVVAIATGESHNLALCSDGLLVAWGYNAAGQLGDNTTTSRLTPTLVPAAGTAHENRRVMAIAAGRHHSLALCSDGTVAAWGFNAYGQLGDGTTTDRRVPTAVAVAGTPLEANAPVAIAAGGFHALALLTDGTVAAWGQNTSGQLGDGTGAQQSQPVAVASAGTILAGRSVVALAAGGSHSLALCADGTLAAWGANTNGQLGENSGSHQLRPVDVNAAPGVSALGTRTVRSLAAGAAHSHALCTDGTVAAWGLNTGGQLGDGTVVSRALPVVASLTALPGGARVVRVAGGAAANHTLAAVAPAPAPEIAVFDGADTSGDERESGATFVFPTTALGATSPAQMFTIQNTGGVTLTGLAVNKSGANAGDFALGALGAASLAPGATTTFTVTFAPGAAGARQAVVRVASNDADENPFLITVTGNDPLPVSSFTRAYTWGTNDNGALGDGGMVPTRSAAGPVRTLGTVLAGRPVVAVAGGWDFTIALCADGTLATWGRNNYGQLGNGTTTASILPVAVIVTGTALEGRTVTAISAGAFHAVALCTDGTIVTWGENGAGTLGNGTTGNRSTPVAVVTAGTVLEGKTVVSVVAGNGHNLALCSDGTLAAWGLNWTGQLGDSTITNRSTPVAVTVAGTALEGKTVVALAAGQIHSLALCSDGTVVAWGYNANYQLGDGTTTARHTATAVLTAGSALAGKSVTAIAAGADHALALCSDGTLVAWGNNSDGQLGDGAGLHRASPYAVATAGTALDGKTIVSLAGGRQHSLALCSDGTAFAWGRGAVGQLGSGNTTFQLAPVPLSTAGLPPGGRLVAISAGVYSDHSQGIVAAPAYADVAVFLADVGSEFTTTPAAYTFATTPVAGATTQIFAVANTGTTPLTGLALSKLGTDAADFLLGPLTTTTLAPDAILNFTVTFSPTGPGPRVATVRVASDDPDENPFEIAVSGTDGTLLARWTTGQEALVTAASYTATGKTVDFVLNHAPEVGATLTVVNNTGLDFIAGTYANLAQGQLVALDHDGSTYNFIANYFGGTGNDLVLEWAGRRMLGWGANANSQLANGSTANATTPIVIPSNGALAGKTVLAVALGKFHTLALCSDGTIAAWGLNTSGQLGDGTTVSRTVPVAAFRSAEFATKTVAAIAAGGNHSLAVCSDGTVFAWGSNSNGQLGDGTTTNRSVPTAVNTAANALTGKKVVAAAGGLVHSIALCADGAVVGWGYSANGQLGYGSSAQTPVAVTTMAAPAPGVRRAVSISTQENHGLVLFSDGAASAWGFNPHGQIGDGSTTSRYSPVSVVTAGTPLVGKAIAALQAGDAYSIALAADGTFAAWGYNNSGQLGDGTTTNRSLPRAPIITGTALDGRTPVALAAGMEHTFLLCSDGALVAWGRNDCGQLGDGGTVTRGTAGLVDLGVLGVGEKILRVRSGAGANHSFAFTALPALATAEIAVHVGESVAFADEVQSGATARDLGRWQVGTGTVATYTIRNTGGADLTGIALAKTGAHAADFTLGSLGATTLAPGASASFTVTFTPSASGIRNGTLTISSSDPNEPSFSIALTGTGVTPLTATFNTATDVPATAASYIAGGNSVNLTLNFAPVAGTSLTVVKNTGAAFISGEFTNLAHGQPVTLTFGGSEYRFIANYHGGTGNDLVLVWARTRPFAWGRNSSGQLGDGTTTARYAPAAANNSAALAGRTILALAGGEAFTLALADDGTIFAWGDNSSGQLGDGTSTPRAHPTAVPVAGTALAGKRVVGLAAGRAHALALCSDGTVAAWGDNALGQLGDGTTVSRAVPTAVSLASALNGKVATGLAAGNGHSLALLSDGTVVAWGDNTSGQLGDGTTTQRLAPVAVAKAGNLLATRTVVSLAAGSFHNLALCSDGTLAAWGWNFFYQLGDSTTTTRTVPTGVSTAGTPLAGRSIAALSAGYIHSLALCTDGTLAVWGDNANSQLGNGGTTGYGIVPTAVPTTATALQGRTAAAIATGGFHNLLLCTDGTLVAWGRGSEGQIGDFAGTRRASAVEVTLSALSVGERIGMLARGTHAFHSIALAAAAPAPEIAVFTGTGTTGTEWASGAGNFAFAGTLPGAASGAQTFTIHNTGEATLSGLALTKTGAHPGDFALGALGTTSLAPGATTTFTVTFQPAAAGPRSATVAITSNDADENPFNLAVGGTGLVALDSWRNTHFGTTANTGSAANLADPDGDGLANLVEFALGLDPLAADDANLPAASATETEWVFTYRRAAAAGVTFSVEISADLLTWSSEGITLEAIETTAETITWRARYPRASMPGIFFRVHVAAP